MSAQQRRAHLGAQAAPCLSGPGEEKRFMEAGGQPTSWNAFSSCSSLDFRAQDPLPALCLSPKVSSGCPFLIFQ